MSYFKAKIRCPFPDCRSKFFDFKLVDDQVVCPVCERTFNSAPHWYVWDIIIVKD